MVVQHQPRRNHDVRRHQACELDCTLAREDGSLRDVFAPEQGERHQRQHDKLRAASNNQGHAQASSQIPATRVLRRTAAHPQIQAPHRKRQAHGNGKRIERRELQQIQDAAAHDQRNLQQQVQAQADALEMIAREPVEQSRTTQHEHDDGHEHADSRREIRPGQQIERQVEHKHGNHAEVHIVMPVVVGNVEEVLLARFLLQLIAGALVVRIVHFLKPLRWGFLQVQLAMSHGFGKLGVLLSILTADFERVGDTGAIPRPGIVGAGSNTYQVRAHKQIGAEQHDLDSHGGDQRSLGFTRIANDADAVDGRLRTEDERKCQNTQREQEARLVEQERFLSVDGHVGELHRVVDILAGDSDLKVGNQPRGVQIDVLALIAQRVDIHLGHADRVLGGIEIRAVGLVGELDLHLQLLGRLPIIEVQPHVVNLRVEVLELDDVINLGNSILVVKRLRKRQAVVQIGSVVPRRAKVIEVEHERFQHQSRKHQQHGAFQHVLYRSAMLKHKLLVPVGYVLFHGRHTANHYTG